MMDLTDTICALSTPPGRSGIAIVRVSGSQSIELFRRIFACKKSCEQPVFRQALLGRIIDPLNKSEIDEAIAICFAGPNSYTGEDMVEFSIHGSPVLIAELIDSLCRLGARLAEPGEFSLRAFVNGRLDLTQAEAINDIIHATTLYQAKVAARQHSGALAQQLKPVKDQIIDIIVNLESAVEFVEENLPTDARDQIARKLEQIRRSLKDWIESYRKGRIIREGFSMAIIGRPNVGKSSIFNALLAQDRSIVAEIPGTTRDLISEYMNIGGIPVRLLDTAGIQRSDDHIEKLGMDRSFQAMADTDAILLVVDISRPRSGLDSELRQQLSHLSCITVMNKSDLISKWSAAEKREFADAWPYVEVSAKTGSGIEELRSAILKGLLGTDGIYQDTVLITNLRHVQNIEAAEKHLEEASAALGEGLSEEFALVHLHKGLKRLGAITGETGVEDLLTEVFSRFCIGK
ncbi:MAG: tRNA uridine-5-carboxymethylaminomethyl(34) synthesis GTPase MnmE [Acidobacteria bacterium]|nr:tRNA uridine-5-carboxymethylaminomethyl(34) synthesis GTPase MnmE [Acidobacteriota bacterium]